MTRNLAAVSLLLGALALGGLAAPQAHAGDGDKKAKSYSADKGSDKVDVSGFPPAIQEAYKAFAVKCSRCHTLARPINTDMPTAGWKRYVKRMMNKPDSGISPTQGKKIYKFLKFYQKRKDARKEAGKEKKE